MSRHGGSLVNLAGLTRTDATPVIVRVVAGTNQVAGAGRRYAAPVATT
jgi:hypothetical protein